MICQNCSVEIDDKAVICVHCGAATPNLAALGLKPSALKNIQNNHALPKATKTEPVVNNSKYLPIVGFLLSLVGFIMYVFSSIAQIFADLSLKPLLSSLSFFSVAMLIAGFIVSIVECKKTKGRGMIRGFPIAGIAISAAILSIFALALIFVIIGIIFVLIFAF